MRRWLVHHGSACALAVRRLVRTPLATLFNVMVIAVALSLPVALYTVMQNVQLWSQHLAADPQITIFLKTDATRADAADIEKRLRQREDVKRYTFVPRDEALETMKKNTGLTEVLHGIERNPLPDAFVVEARDPSARSLEALRDVAAKWPRVELAQLDSLWARRLEGALRTARMAVFALATLLAFALVAVTFNTIRLQILTRRLDIEVAQLFGATAGYVRRPFLYDGTLLGLLGGAAGAGLVAGALLLVNRELASLSDLYGVVVGLQPLGAADVVAVLGFAGFLGWLGAWLSLAQHLAASAPR